MNKTEKKAQKDFLCLSISPGYLAHPGLAVAATRAGGVGLLDCEFCPEQSFQQLKKNLNQLVNDVGQGLMGLRMHASQLEKHRELFEALDGNAFWLLLSSWCSSLDELAGQLPNGVGKVLFEVTRAEELELLKASSTRCDAVVVKGAESGGWVGEESAFILTQRASAHQAFPFFVQGGIGPSTAAACRAIGAAGVVWDDQLWLMPESPLPMESRQLIRRLDGEETSVIGVEPGVGCRVLLRHGLKPGQQLKQRCLAVEKDLDHSGQWQDATDGLIGWGAPEELAWPLGQAVRFAAELQAKFKSTGRLFEAVQKSSLQDIETVREHKPFDLHSPLARAHGTRYPVVQGPMTRVSDTASFADAVAEAGGLPFVALALMDAQQSRALLQKSRETMGDRPWGVGILGFVPQELRTQQIREIQEVNPPFAIIAGGRPDQAATLEAKGTATYIHAPTPGILKMFLARGARRFVFEGGECGGHTGPLSSFVLWQSVIDTVQREVRANDMKGLHLLFAGGIHDDRSAAILGVLAAPLVAAGVHVGLLMGSAYLFTNEAVDRGAITQSFQDQALECCRTVSLETSPGHAIRCIDTPFTESFLATRRQLLREEKSGVEARETMEALTRGRLRLASKGLMRNEQGSLDNIEPEEQLENGLYMIGQLGSLRSKVTTMEDLHREVCKGSVDLLDQYVVSSDNRLEIVADPMQVAIVGIGLLLPKARTPEEFWSNLIDKREVVSEVPKDRWDWRLFFDQDKEARDKMYSRWGGFLEDVPFDPLSFGIPPNSVPSIAPMQLLALEAVRLALADAGYEDGSFDRENTSMILGVDSGGLVSQQYNARVMLPLVTAPVDEKAYERLPEWTEETFAGNLANVVAGRVANRFDLGGSNFIVNSACASSLKAVELAARELTEGRANVVIAGGADTAQDPYTFMGFAKTQALSPTGRCKVFGSDADGIVISEGLVITVLKRLDDAERDGDRIYSVIRGASSSSDGRALAMTAPRPLGQRRALVRSYEAAGISPTMLGLYEAHGTGTQVGDKAEVETVTHFMAEYDAVEKSCAIGSAKHLLGHTKVAAGALGVAKMALSLYHKVLPPHGDLDNPLPALSDPHCPLYLLREARPWFAHPNHARYGAVSAFGFGGTNTHAILEEYRSPYRAETLGGTKWPCELIVLRAKDRGALERSVQDLLKAFGDGAQPGLHDLAYTCARNAQTQRDQPLCLSLVAKDLEDLQGLLVRSLSIIRGNSPNTFTRIALGEKANGTSPPLAFIFPGQGSQYPDMAREVALYFPEMRSVVEQADQLLGDAYPRRLSQYIYPPGAYNKDDAELHNRALKDTHVAQPAIGATSLGLFDLAIRIGLKPERVCGHSYGELTALHAAGALSRDDFLRLSQARGQAMATSCLSPGGMAAVHAPMDEVEGMLAQWDDVVIANNNAPKQVVISGPSPSLQQAIKHLETKGLRVRQLPVIGAFHSPLMRSALSAFQPVVEDTQWHTPQLPVYAGHTTRPHIDASSIRDQVLASLEDSVNFQGTIQQMHDDGTRIFLEVGPKSVLSSLVSNILDGQEHLAVSLDSNGGKLQGFLATLGVLLSQGIEMDLPELFAGREVKALDLRTLAETTRPTSLSPTTWLINGDGMRQHQKPDYRMGSLPLMDLEAANAAKKAAEAERSAKHVQANRGPEVPPTMEFSRNGANAYASYQETMKQFLRLQETTMKMFLSSGQVPAGSPDAMSLPEGGFATTANHTMNNPFQFTEPVSPPVPTQPSAPPPQAANVPEEPGPKEPGPVTTWDATSITEELVQLVSDRTGYPSNMLNPDLDLEAELSVDSIKRIEIIDQILKGLPGSWREALEGAMEQLIRAKSLRSLTSLIMGSAPASPSQMEDEPAHPTGRGSGRKMPNKQELIDSLTGLVSDLTGYPIAMLGASLDLEAELSIDSIKRIEIIDKLLSSLPTQAQQSLEGQMETLTAAKSFEALAEVILGSSNGEARPSESKSIAVDACDRYLMEAQAASPPGACVEPTGLFLVASDPNGMASLVAEGLAVRGANTVILDRTTLNSPHGIEEAVAQARKEHGPVRGIVHLSALTPPTQPEDMAAWHRDTQIQAKSLFQLLKFCAEDLCFEGSGGETSSAGRVLFASMLGGYFARGPRPSKMSLPIAGAGCGLLKTLKLEWPQINARALDFDDSLAPSVMSAHILEELLDTEARVEVGYPKGNRTVFQAVHAPLRTNGTKPQYTPDANWVVVVTGGAHGITAEITRSIIVEGMTLVILGRSPAPGVESSETAHLGEAALRRALIEKAQASGEAFSPAQIERDVQRTLRSRKMSRNLDRFRELGARVEYHSVDVANEQSFGSCLEGLYATHGRIDGVIHGAGVIEDKLIIDKTVSSFDHVFDTKVDSTFILSRYLREDTLKLLVLFTSTAGRFGNRGQADYAAANEALNRMAWQLQFQWPSTRVTAINWGPWSDVGMASNPVVIRQMESRGVRPIKTDEGVRFFNDEIRFGKTEDVEVIAGYDGGGSP